MEQSTLRRRRRTPLAAASPSAPLVSDTIFPATPTLSASKLYCLKMERNFSRMLKLQSDGNQDLGSLSNLPPEIISEIFSRLFVRSIIKSKLVCRAWLDMVESREFANQRPYLIVFVGCNPVYRILELGHGSIAPDKFVTFSLPSCKGRVHSSVNGLILLFQHLLICNPITREYFRLPEPPEHPDDYLRFGSKHYSRKYSGFGVSRTNKQYKLVRVFQSECQVYTLGTGQWRSIAVVPLPEGNHLQRHRAYICDYQCAFVGGNLHWLDLEIITDTTCSIYCFDLETEVLTSFSAPPPPPPSCRGPDCKSYRSLSVLEDCLCLCDVSRQSHRPGVEIDVWLRRGEHWRKEFVINDDHRPYANYGYPIKMLGDGSMLLWMIAYDCKILHYSSKDNAKYGGGGCIRLYPNADHSFGYDHFAVVYTPNFFPLKTLINVQGEDVRSF